MLILHLVTADSCVQRVAGFTEVIDAHNKVLADDASKIEIIETLPGGGNQQKSKKSTEDFVQGNKDLRAIFAINDPSALGAYTGAEAGGPGKTGDRLWASMASKPASRRSRTARFLPTRCSTRTRWRKITIKSIVEYIDGKKPEKLIKIPAELYFKEDADKDPALK